jgi:hypothetical protein
MVSVRGELLRALIINSQALVDHCLKAFDVKVESVKEEIDEARAILDAPPLPAPADLREALADLSHDIWAHWMRYLFLKCDLPEPEDGRYIIPAGLVQRWTRQCETPYAQLSEREKDSDREQADKILAVLPAPVGWVPVAERMPEDMKPVGVWSEGFHGWFCDIARWNPEFDTWQTELWGEGGWVPYGGDITVTHWIELPAKVVGE